MKKLLLTLCIGFLVLSFLSCAAKPIRRGFQDNVFYSSAQPIMGLQMNPDFRYVKNKASTRTGFDQGGGNIGRTALVSSVTYAFVTPDNKRAVIVDLKYIGASHLAFQPNLFPIKDPFDKGRVEVLGFNYQYCTYAITHQSRTFLVKGFGRLVGPLNNSIILAHYVEKQDEIWDTTLLTDAQKKTLSQFEAACDKDLDLVADPIIPEKEAFEGHIDLSDEEYNKLKSFVKTLVFPRSTFSTRKN